MTTITFTFDGTKFDYSIDIDGSSPVIIPDQSAIISTPDLVSRFFADIVKDGQGSGTNLTDFMQRAYRYNGTAWQRTLNDLETRLFGNPAIDIKTTKYKNILRNSTIGFNISNTRISDARNVFWESGMSSKNIMAAEEDKLNKIQTPAAQLDSLGKESHNSYWPTDISIIFDSSFLQGIGFPEGMRWEYYPGVGVRITYSNGAGYIVFTVKPGLSNVDTKRQNGENGKYLEGNNYKNDKIKKDTSMTNEVFIKYVETKEFGDVAQVLVYLAFVLVKFSETPSIPKTSSVMITTDGVVHFLNCYFNLSSIYTGSRIGVESGHCTLYSYLAGDVDLKLKFQNMIENYYLRIKSQLSATRFGFNIMRINPSQFWYYRSDGARIKKTNGAFQLSSDKKNTVQGFFQAKNDIINQLLERLEGLKVALLGIADVIDYTIRDAADAYINTQFEEWTGQVNHDCNINQVLTKLDSSQYILHPGVDQHLGDILTEYTQIIAGGILPASILQLIEFVKSGGAIDVDISGGGKQRLIRKSNINLSGGGDQPRHGSYYDYIFLCYTNYLLQGKNFDDEFAFLYDYVVSQNINSITFPGFQEWFNKEKISDNYIYTNGIYLQQFVYFADDYNTEMLNLQKELDNKSKSNWWDKRADQEHKAQGSGIGEWEDYSQGFSQGSVSGVHASPYSVTASLTPIRNNPNLDKSKIGGKRRTMKIKKYLKNNRRKTIRKNKKTIRKNKKTHKYKS